MDTQNNSEFDEMRRQMLSLNDKLEKDIVVDDTAVRNLIRKQLAKEMKRWNILLWLAVLLFIVTLVPLFHNPYGVSPALRVFTALICVWAFVRTLLYKIAAKRKDLANADLIVVQTEIIKQKKKNQKHLVWSIILIVVWFIWCMYDVVGVNNSFAGGIACGIIIGVILATIKRYRELKTYNNILRKIEEYVRS